MLDAFQPATRAWFSASFSEPTPPQRLGWPPMARGESTLLLAPTGSGKTLAAFLGCLDRLMFEPVPPKRERCRVLYVSPLKALAVDVERNLRAPLSGIARAAEAMGQPFHRPSVMVRTGDTPGAERARFLRAPADILVTTPESLYLLLTSQAREVLRSIETVIVDEIHALVPTKRGAHLALSLERLERLCGRRLQRIGLSATQRPLEEVARFLGGAEERRARARGARKGGPRRAAGEASLGAEVRAEFGEPAGRTHFRPVTVVDAGSRKALELRIEVPVEDLARPGGRISAPHGAAPGPAPRTSIWSAIYPRLLELVRAHRSTILFVNSRRTAERLAGALNELAGEQLVQAHHGSVARAQRLEIEDRLKAGLLRGLVATSSLELGIDMGAVDLVVQIEAPPSVSSGLQRIGRAGHQVGAPSRGVLFPKYRADLVACAALTEAMREGAVEPSRYPRNPLDVLAQQLVAMAATETLDVDEAFAAVRRAAPFAELSRRAFEGVLDMLSGRYASDDFAELKPRLTWDRAAGTLRAREGARQVAILNGGTIPDRGLYGVFIAGAPRGANRVGELDEEMVFESRVGEVFVLGASSWRIEDITPDRVLVSPAPGVPGDMPFWHGDNVGRPVEVGRRVGRLVRELGGMPKPAALARLTRAHDLEPRAAENLLRYLDDQRVATEVVPDDRHILIERTRDELGDWRVCVLSPFGGRVHAPWAMAVTAKVRRERGLDVETMWTDDGFVVRYPDVDQPPDPSLLLPDPDELEPLLWGQLGATALFAARFRENAARALLLPKRRAGGRTPLWQTRRRASDLLAVAARYPSFPVILETYRECLRDVFDVPALAETLRQVRSRAVKVATRDTQTPSPFASAILFGFVANYLYEGDAPLAERRAQALAIDHEQLRELLGEVALRELLDPDAVEAVERQVRRLDEPLRARSPDSLHDLLLRLGDLTPAEIRARSAGPQCAAWTSELIAARRAVQVRMGGEERVIAVEDAARFRDALGTALPRGLPAVLLAAADDPVGDLVHRYARTHAPFTLDEFAGRYGLGPAAARSMLERAVGAGTLFEGAFRPGGAGEEWCAPEVLRHIRRRSLANLRREVEPVEGRVLSRLLLQWQGVTRRRKGMDALLDAVDQLQGVPLPASEFEREVLPARVEDYSPLDLDALAAAGEVVWVGVEPLGDRDGRIALYLTDQLSRLWRPSPAAAEGLSERARRIVEVLGERGAMFFGDLHQQAGAGYPGQTLEAIWDLAFRGLVTNDLFLPLRAFTRPRDAPARGRALSAGGFRSRREAPPSAEGRWSLVEARAGARRPSDTEYAARLAQQLLARYGVVTRELPSLEGVQGGFGAVYDVFKALEEAGKVRRGFFAADVGALQFASPQAVDLLRGLREEPEEPEVVTLAAADPANAYGALLRWPAIEGAEGRGPTRSVGTHVVLVNGALAAHVGRGGRQVSAWLPEDEPERTRAARAAAEEIGAIAERARAGFELQQINGAPARQHPFASYLVAAGFSAGPNGLYWLRKAWMPRVGQVEAAPSAAETSEHGPTLH